MSLVLNVTSLGDPWDIQGHMFMGQLDHRAWVSGHQVELEIVLRLCGHGTWEGLMP